MESPRPLFASRGWKAVEPMVIERANVSGEENIVEMYINPQRIAIRRRKVIQRVQTNTRWVFQHWGAEPIIISYNGVTGYMNSEEARNYSQKNFPNQPDDFDTKFGKWRFSPYQTEAYRALAKLRSFYEVPHEQMQGADLTQLSGADIDENLNKLVLRLYFRDTMYVGFLTRMEIREEEMSPWMWNYTMEFMAYSSQENVWRTGLVTSVPADELMRRAREDGELELDRNLTAASDTGQTTRPPFVYRWVRPPRH